MPTPPREHCVDLFVIGKRCVLLFNQPDATMKSIRLRTFRKRVATMDCSRGRVDKFGTEFQSIQSFNEQTCWAYGTAQERSSWRGTRLWVLTPSSILVPSDDFNQPLYCRYICYVKNNSARTSNYLGGPLASQRLIGRLYSCMFLHEAK